MTTPPILEKIEQYFVKKQAELRSVADQILAASPVSQGTHRELLVTRYLKQVIPRRYAIGTGTVSGFLGESKQTDIVIWDEFNYPSLQYLGSSAHLLESVKMAIEVKSRWSQTEFTDVKAKTRQLNHISKLPNMKLTLEQQFHRLWQAIHEMRTGMQQAGYLLIRPRPATAAVFINGGEHFDVASASIEDAEIDDDWPDLILLLGAGVVIYKKDVYVYDDEDSEQPSDVEARLIRVSADQRALLVFTNQLLSLLSARSFNFENYAYFSDYVDPILENLETSSRVFSSNRLIPGAHFMDAD